MPKDKSERKEKKEKKEHKSKSRDTLSPVADDTTKVSKKSKKDKKSKADKDISPAVADSLLEVLAEKSGVVSKGHGVDSMKMEVDTDGIIVGGTMKDATVLKDGEEAKGALVPFAKPLAEGKLAKKVLKTVKKAAKTKSLKRGVKEVVKALRKSPMSSVSSTFDPIKTPLLILAGDISPADVISHLPVLAEDHGVPYVFVTSRAELGAAGATKRPTSVVMITPEMGKRKKSKKDGEQSAETLSKIKEEEEEFQKAFVDLVKEVQGVTKALLV